MQPTDPSTAQPAAPPTPAPPAPPPPASRVDLSTPALDAETRAFEQRALHANIATRGSPFFDASVGGLFLEERFGDPLIIGLQGGLFLGNIVRAALRLEMPSTEARDQASNRYVELGTSGSSVYNADSASPKLLYAGALGIVAVNAPNFAFSPGLMLLRSDVSDYGTVIGVSLPFEWITSRGLRFSLEANLGRAFGGKVRHACYNASSNTSCPPSELAPSDRDAGRAIGLRFAIGYGFGYAQRH